uniref:Radical SAM core domain-containing protein n=2 Tax=Meloidogyne TaxID=189290 RepID=A0A915NTX2_9BILA
MPFPNLIKEAQLIHSKHHNPCKIQISALLSIKTGACPENCSYCPQSSFYKTDIKKEPLMDLEKVIKAAKIAKENGATRFCMGAAWRGPNNRDLERVCEMIEKVKELGLETCATLGLIRNDKQAEKLKQAVCCGGILGMGETNEDRVKMLTILANMEPAPESVPINKLIKIPGTPLANAVELDSFDFVRTIATARLLMPKAYIRLSAGREQMGDELQALCFLAGANSLFYGEKLLTAANPTPEHDLNLLKRLGMSGETIEENKEGEC